MHVPRRRKAKLQLRLHTRSTGRVSDVRPSALAARAG